MVYDKEFRLINDHDLFAEDYVPLNIHTREAQIKELVFCISSVANSKKPINAWVYGKPGTGKTAVCKFLIRKLKYESKIDGLYINCWENPTYYAVIDKMVRELRILGAEKLNTSFKFERLQNHLKGKPFVLFLDEIDHPHRKEREDILYNFCNMQKIGIVAISNNKYILYSLDERIKSRLNAQWIEFKPYSEDDLLFILKQRAYLALDNDSYDKSILKKIAELADCDARIAVQTLKNAAYLAEKEFSKCITHMHIHDGFKSAKKLKKSYLLNKLTEHHRILYNLIKENKGIQSGKLLKIYIKKCRKLNIRPVAKRTYSEYMRKLIEIDLVKSERALVKGKVRAFKAAK